MHFNDNCRSWNDGMIVGSVHFVESSKLLFRVRATGCAGLYSMDQYNLGGGIESLKTWHFGGVSRPR